MSKEQTPIDELIEKCKNSHYADFVEKKFIIAELEKALSETYTKEQFKEAVVHALDMQLNESETSYKKYGCEKQAEEYFKEKYGY
jgi:hypothetical protein